MSGLPYFVIIVMHLGSFDTCFADLHGNLKEE